MKLALFAVMSIAIATVGNSTTASAAGNPPTVAVYGFSSQGLSPWWGSNFDPGDALSDLLTDRLVKLGTLSVIDREHIQQVLTEQQRSQQGQVTPATQAQLGQMVGARYLFVGRIVQFAKTGGNSTAGVSRLLGGLGGASSTKTELSVSVQVIEANTGRIVQAIDDDQTATVTSFTIGGGSATGGVAYTSQQFQSSALGQLFGTVADDVAKKVEPDKLAAASGPAISGHIVGIDGDSIILNVGSSKGVSIGMMFIAADVKQFADPDNPGKMISSEIPQGTLQVISVSDGSSVAKKISGTVKVGQTVDSQQ